MIEREESFEPTHTTTKSVSEHAPNKLPTTMDALHTQLAQIRTRLDDVPALQKLEVSLPAGCLRYFVFSVELQRVLMFLEFSTSGRFISYFYYARNKRAYQKNIPL